MKHIFYFSCLLIALLMASCNKFEDDYELIDYAEHCAIEKNKSVTLFKEGEIKKYALSSTKDYFVSYPKDLCDTTAIYVYQTGNKIVASEINFQDAKVLRDYIQEKESICQEDNMNKAIFLAVL